VKEEGTRKDRIYADHLSKVGGFVFDESVAHVFDDMIRRSVPCYAMTLSLMPLIVQRYAQKNSTIYDLGCSLGAGLAAIAKSLPKGTSLVGVDISQSMLNRCQINLQDAIPQKKWSLKCSDILDLDITNASVVILNFTLQFIPLESRLHLLSRIAKGLEPGGALLLSEKIRFQDDKSQQTLTDLHHDFKKANGYSDLEVSQKRAAIENVLIPESIQEHRERLNQAGFDHSEVWLQCFNFASLLAIKASD
tara:strand:+ start:774 stop:1520 length:747 start_codon:yes stop_codon:yes gene_type:complete